MPCGSVACIKLGVLARVHRRQLLPMHPGERCYLPATKWKT